VGGVIAAILHDHGGVREGLVLLVFVFLGEGGGGQGQERKAGQRAKRAQLKGRYHQVQSPWLTPHRPRGVAVRG